MKSCILFSALFIAFYINPDYTPPIEIVLIYSSALVIALVTDIWWFLRAFLNPPK